jgi:hypothetical protein
MPKHTIIGLLFFGVFLWSNVLYAQSYKDYIITQSGEKISGEVDRNYDFNRYRTLKFKTADGVTRSFSSNDLKEFKLSNGRYFRSIQLEGSNTKEFVQVLVSGKYTLLVGQKIYFIDHGDSLYKLDTKYIAKEFGNKNVSIYSRRPFQGVLIKLMAEECKLRLNALVNRTNYDEEQLIHFIRELHLCEGELYEVHVEKIPIIRFSPVVMAGATAAKFQEKVAIDGRTDVFENQMFPAIQGGLSIYGLRKLPRFSADIRIGYSVQNNTIHASHISTLEINSGKEKIKSSTLFVPIFVNYSVFRRGNSDFHIGVGGTFRHNSTTSEFAILDQTVLRNEVTILTEKTFVSRMRSRVNPAFKVGSSIKLNKKLGGFVELQFDQMKNEYSVILPKQEMLYNQLFSTLSLGLKF